MSKPSIELNISIVSNLKLNTEIKIFINIYKSDRACHRMIKTVNYLSSPFSIKTLFGHLRYSFNNLQKLDEQSQKLINLLSQNHTIRLWSLSQLSH
jgi:hypothetical protein